MMMVRVMVTYYNVDYLNNNNNIIIIIIIFKIPII
jgi:hypothetical protein